MEFIIDLPWRRFKASSITTESVESIMMVDLTFLVTWSRNSTTSFNSFRSGSCRQTSSTCAPPLICLRPTSAASSKDPWLINLRNRRLPNTLVRSPTMTGRVSSSTTRASIPDSRVSDSTVGILVDFC